MQDEAHAGILTRRQELAETGVFLLLIVPSMALSFLAESRGALPFPVVAASTILRDAGLVALILLLLSRARQPVAAVGWVRRDIGQEILVGLALSVPVLIGAALLVAALRTAGLSRPRTGAAGLLPSSGFGDLLLAIVLVTVVAVAEETIFRGYLILRFKSVLQNRAWAVLLSTLVFSVGHGYEGGAGVLTVGMVGLVFAVVYEWRGSLVAPVVMHFVVNFVSIVLGPLLRR
ncbi:CPBP family intramembrane glutamic endopeptidase [Streptomyces sp. WMMB 322]|uniref:CPBP family intramembrane glutamic endopeptidase n=1 Tax=Streptomyces sp. WMMB 322 TaxID=1286821 RepID=UPI0006E458A5|nr:CPBP family intramembrane glutamic endopeptidase [Streptomyces sp. WMMB 322]SCK30684.1 CAAX protease self-immunity [Streptomyces sp. WMMB 322]